MDRCRVGTCSWYGMKVYEGCNLPGLQQVESRLGCGIMGLLRAWRDVSAGRSV
jgi:hypothetical protein